ncbi:related to protein-tyrosine-phosphatase [Rhynchosporium secalis]|uniref:protein-tyrosine-phosphatase n=1 Tax=Rhynchosporium secalis TaxID=38038 RepID=A0A1E1M0W2_RHYSE|nr:related to protein-tyrosine-phosphatase [Rhynchosporium secalis]
MVTKTTTRPPPRSAHSHSYSSSNRTSSKSSTTPTNPLPRVAASVGQAHPPNAAPFLRSPAVQNDNARTPSPNYFGLIVDPASDPRDSGVGPKDNWSPPSSSIRSFGAATPQHLPLDANPDFAAFRKQAEGPNAFSLGHGNLSHFSSTPSAQARPKPERRSTRSETQDNTSPKSKPRPRQDTPDRMDLDGGSLNAPSFFDIPRQQSPAPMNESDPSIQRNILSNLDDRHPRLSLPQNKADPPSPQLKLQQKTSQHRADTLPSSLEDGPALISTAQLKDMMERLPSSQFLLLDLRVFPQFSQSRINGALNLCIPTTLLKRPSFNLQKLQDTFTNDAEKARFAEWKSAKYLLVYDASSYEKKDAVSAVNTLKKFSNEGWEGASYIVRGGFADFSKNFPHLIDNRSSHEMQSSKISLSLGTSGPEVAPVAGGCLMPATKNAANPFFSNIRQNQDLIGGVGQMDLKIPDELAPEFKTLLPRWLIKTCAADDHGKIVSDKFLRLELAEQSRMTKALSSGVSWGTPAPGSKEVQIAGIEKGSKNRYNNIWPFEHTRVRVQGRAEGACDYVNASHIKSSRSHKQYIASQGPLPATFEDFWSVIWDQDVRVIVMLTAESEGGQLKCHQYWTGKAFGPLKLRALSEKKVALSSSRSHSPKESRDSGRRRANTTAETTPPAPTDKPYAIIRKFTLSHSGHPFSPMREITQVHYSSWPDFGAPASPGQLLGLVELSNVIQRASMAPTQSTRSDEPESAEISRPMLVHCSAGCGRTGTFCTIDTVIDMLKRQRKEAKSGTTPMETTAFSGDYMSSEGVSGDWIFDQDVDLIEKTVEDFRGQRLSMVQSLRQYALCYETILEWISHQLTGSGRSSRERRGSDSGLERTNS